MQIGSANRGGGNTQNDRPGCSMPGSGTFSTFAMWTVIRQCFHAASGGNGGVAFDYKRVAIPEKTAGKTGGFRIFSGNTRLLTSGCRNI